MSDLEISEHKIEQMSLRGLISEEVTRQLDAIVHDPVALRVRRFREGAELPSYGTNLAAGMDVRACILRPSLSDVSFMSEGCIEAGVTLLPFDILIPPHGRKLVPTGLNLRIPIGYEVQVRPRSGMALKQGLTVLNTPGTVDADYDGDGEKYELGVILQNHSEEGIIIKHGERIAQIVLAKVQRAVIVEDFDDNANRNPSNRDGGYGSTGKA